MLGCKRSADEDRGEVESAFVPGLAVFVEGEDRGDDEDRGAHVVPTALEVHVDTLGGEKDN